MTARRRSAPAAADGHLLFAPWRMAYVRSLGKAGTPRCPFCPMAARGADATALRIVHRGRHGFLVLNLYPYTTGHLLAVPNRHVGAVERLRPAERGELWELALLGRAALDKAYHPAGFNLGMNLGRAGGAAVVGHVHLHVVPRYEGDSNFVPVVGGTRLCPEDLDTTYARVRRALGR